MARFEVPILVEVEAEDSESAWEQVISDPVSAVLHSFDGVFVGEAEEVEED